MSDTAATTQPGMIRPVKQGGMAGFDFEVFNGVTWVTLNDHINFYVGGDSLGSNTQGRRRFTVQSSMYDGDFEVHSTASSVTEQVTVYVLGATQLDVSDNIESLRKWFSQATFNIRITRDEVRETWRCFPAEWSVDRGQVMSHNKMAQMRLSIPRFPKVTYEAVV